MLGDGKEIAKILTRSRFSRVSVQSAQLSVEDDPSRENADISAWFSSDYPRLVQKLAKLPEFANPEFDEEGHRAWNEAEKRADAYICGYVRGLREAAYQGMLWSEPPQDTLKPAKKRTTRSSTSKTHKKRK